MESPPQRPVAIRGICADQTRIQNVSTGITRPLYTACSGHFHEQGSKWEKTSICSFPAAESADETPVSNNEQGWFRFFSWPGLTSYSSSRETVPSRPSAFLQLPVEIRLQIYSYLVLPAQTTDLLPSFEKVSASTQDYFDYDKKSHGVPVTADLSHPTLLFRTIDPARYKNRYPTGHDRSTYNVRADRFRARCMQTTYHCVNNPRIEDSLAFMRCNKQIHAEACDLLYSSYTFDFDSHIEAIVPFLSDLTPFARSCVRSVRIVKRALPYLKAFEQYEWHNALRYLTSPSTGINLRRLELGVVAGRPGEHGWDCIPRYTTRDFEKLQDMEGMKWMHYLLEMRNLEKLDVEAVVEHCPPTDSSSTMEDYVRFSASVETGFAEFLQGRMVARRQRML